MIEISLPVLEINFFVSDIDIPANNHLSTALPQFIHVHFKSIEKTKFCALPFIR